jgi:hypothetical protein
MLKIACGRTKTKTPNLKAGGLKNDAQQERSKPMVQ